MLQAGHRLVTLTGPGGTGKSRLSIALATEVAASFAGGAWFVDLTGLREAHLLLSAIARTLGVQESGSKTLSETLQEALQESPTLLVLDNFEQLMDAAAAWPRCLSHAPPWSWSSPAARRSACASSRSFRSARWACQT